MTVVAQIDHEVDELATVIMVVDYGDDELPDAVKEGMQEDPPTWLDVTNADPRPGPQWTWDGTTFSQPEVQTNQAMVASRISDAIAANVTFLEIEAPTADQQTAQIKALTSQVNALARFTTGQFDAAT